MFSFWKPDGAMSCESQLEKEQTPCFFRKHFVQYFVQINKLDRMILILFLEILKTWLFKFTNRNQNSKISQEHWLQRLEFSLCIIIDLPAIIQICLRPKLMDDTIRFFQRKIISRKYMWIEPEAKPEVRITLGIAIRWKTISWMVSFMWLLPNFNCWKIGQKEGW